jgi:hypothetical protein
MFKSRMLVLFLVAALLAGCGAVSLTGSGNEGVDLLPADGACTSFCLDNGGKAVFGSNYDSQNEEGLLFLNKRGVTKTGWEAGTTGKYARWTAEYGSVTFSVVGVQMAWACMNEAGLSISTMAGPANNPAPDERPPLDSPLWIQYQLDTSATIEDVMANDSRIRINDTVEITTWFANARVPAPPSNFWMVRWSFTPARPCRSRPWQTLTT